MTLQTRHRASLSEIIANLTIGLTVSIVALNLGIAFGVLSGRGAVMGMLSAGLIALITSLFGGTRIQGSGTTAPMSTVTAVLVAFAIEQLPQQLPGVNPDHFINLVLLMTAGFMFVFGALRLGQYISYVPKLVISGFMCGIALTIWVLQAEILFGIGRAPMDGSMGANILLITLALSLNISF